jgi:hypothetical protein
MIVVADASLSGTLFSGLQSARLELLSRFGAEIDIHLVALGLK